MLIFPYHADLCVVGCPDKLPNSGGISWWPTDLASRHSDSGAGHYQVRISNTYVSMIIMYEHTVKLIITFNIFHLLFSFITHVVSIYFCVIIQCRYICHYKTTQPMKFLAFEDLSSSILFIYRFLIHTCNPHWVHM